MFEEVRGGFMANIMREKFMAIQKGKTFEKDVVSNVGSMSAVQLTERQKEILDLIIKDSFISAQQMSVILSVVKRTIERDLAAMQKKGILLREGNTSAGHWVINDSTQK